MRIKQSKTRGQKLTPAPLAQRRKARKWASLRPKTRSATMVPFVPRERVRRDPIQWLAFFALAIISGALITLIWTLTEHSIQDQTVETRARVDQQVKSVAGVLAQDIQHEMLLVDQSLAIIQDAWKKDSDSVNLGEWRKQLLALTAVADDIFVADERRVIVQGTLPKSIGQGFGSAYVSYTNGSLEVFEADGTRSPTGRISASSVSGSTITARQFLMYVLRPLDRPRGWFVGASYRSEEITKLFASANLGQGGVIALIEMKRGTVQAIVGPSAQLAEVGLGGSELVEAMRKSEAGIWTGPSPFDRTNRIIGYQRIPGRDLSVVVGVDMESAMRPVDGLVNWARGLAAVGSVVVLTIAGLVFWGVMSVQDTRRRQKTLERAELDLTHTRNELGMARARIPLTGPEVGTLVSSQTDGVARLDQGFRLRQWNARFAQCIGMPLDLSALGMPVEDLLRRQSEAGLFGDGDPQEQDQEIAKRLTILHNGGQSAVPPFQLGAGGETLTMHARAVLGGGCVLTLTGPENALLAPLPPLPSEAQPETAEETTDW